MKTTYRQLNGKWQVRQLTCDKKAPLKLEPISATVPGHVHLDLMAAGVIPDPFKRMYEYGVSWVDDSTWAYETTFTITEPVPPHTMLIFHGLDTVAEILLDGEVIGAADNMFIPHEFPIGKLLQGISAGEHTLKVVFLPAKRVGDGRKEAWRDSTGGAPSEDSWGWTARSFIRKAQYMFGWDWGPVLRSCGIWRPVEIVSVPVARLLDWNHSVEFRDDGSAVIDIQAYVERAPGDTTPLTVSASISQIASLAQQYDDRLPEPDSITIPLEDGRLETRMRLTVPVARRWWPHQHNATGESAPPPLYTVDLQIRQTASDEVTDEKTARLGLRTIELLHEPDSDGKGEGFKFRVNGQDIFAKGGNWIPADSFPSRLNNESRFGTTSGPENDRIPRLLHLAKDAGFNMLRVWGGGLYESESFYEICDELGILVWQDFPYACHQHPDDTASLEVSRQEATAAVRRLRTHASLALLCGNNEIDQLFGPTGKDWSRFYGRAIYHDILPEVVSSEAPNVSYWPSSPYGGPLANEQNWGDSHNWDVWHGSGDWKLYAEDRSRFCSEFGFAASCNLPAWQKCLNPEDWSVKSPSVRSHEKTGKGYETYLEYVSLYYPEPKTLEDLVYYSQCNQLDAMTHAVEHYRRLKGHCWGTLAWQFNDCWPVHSWSWTDSELELKAAYYGARRFYKPVLVSASLVDREVAVSVVNDTLTEIAGTVYVRRETYTGEVHSEFSRPIVVPANGVVRTPAFSICTEKNCRYGTYIYAAFVSSASIKSETILNLTEPKDIGHCPSPLHASLRATGSGTSTLCLLSNHFAPYVWIRAQDVSSSAVSMKCSDNFFHLRAGESREIILASELLGSIERENIIIRTMSGNGVKWEPA